MVIQLGRFPIEDVIDRRNEKARKFEKETDDLEDVTELLRKIRDGNANSDDVDTAMSRLLCWNSISFCCASPENPDGSGKECPYRDSLLKALDISREDFEEMKSKMEESFLEKALRE